MLKPENLTANPLFRGFDINELEKLLRCAERQNFNKEDVIFKQGEEGRKLYIIEKGMVNIVLKLKETTQLTIATETSGGAFGWSALIPPHRYTTDVKCLEPCQLLAFDGTKVRELCYQEPNLGVKLMENLACFIATRLQHTNLAMVGAMWE